MGEIPRHSGNPGPRHDGPRRALKYCAFVSIDKILRRGIILIYSPDRAPRAIVKSTSTSTILATDLPGFELHGRGKVRDVYRVDDRLLIVATDRLSAFDYVLPTGIPDKGRVLTQLS